MSLHSSSLCRLLNATIIATPSAEAIASGCY